MRGNILDRVSLELTPYLREPLQYVGDSRVKWIGIFAPTQSGKSVFLQGAVADAIDQDPGPLLYLFPDERSGKKQLKEKIISMIEKSPFLAKHKTGRVHDISKDEVYLDNMSISPGWAGSLGSMSSTSYKRVVLDEVRLMPLTTGSESNAIKFSGDRLTTYFDMGIGQGYMVSSPSTEGDLLHQQLDIPGTTVLYWQVPCPHCGEYQELDFFVNMKWNEKEETAKCLCRYCNGEFRDDNKKVSWNKGGVYAPKDAKIRQDGSLIEPFEITERLFFHWSSMESPFRRFHLIWSEYVQTKGKLHDYKNFWQCWLARFWVEDESRTSIVALRERREKYYKRDVDKRVKVITAGIDTQDHGFYVVVRGWGKGKFTCLIDQFNIKCEIEVSTESEIRDLFIKNIFNTTYAKENGEKWKVAMTAIDTGGHKTTNIYNIATGFPGLILVKGRNNQSKTIVYSKENNLYLTRTVEYLEETEDRCLDKNWILPYNVEEDFLSQYCNIRKRIFTNKRTGEKKVEWIKIGQNDYRFADLHTMICLDVPTEDQTTIRKKLEIDDFKLNPAHSYAEVNKQESYEHTNYEEQGDFGINSFRW